MCQAAIYLDWRRFDDDFLDLFWVSKNFKRNFLEFVGIFLIK